MREVEPENGGQHEEAAELGKDEELDRCPKTIFMAPQENEEEHGHQHELPGKIEEKEVEGEKDAQNACDGPAEAEVEGARSFRDLRERGESRHGTQKGGEGKEEETYLIGGKMEGDARLRKPGTLKLRDPAGRGAIIGLALEQEIDDKHEIDGQGEKCNPSRQLPAPPLGEQGRNTRGHRERENAYEHHPSTAIKMKTAAPMATPMTYQRTLPDWVKTRSVPAELTIRAVPS